jgi:hypothetical protein
MTTAIASWEWLRPLTADDGKGVKEWMAEPFSLDGNVVVTSGPIFAVHLGGAEDVGPLKHDRAPTPDVLRSVLGPAISADVTAWPVAPRGALAEWAGPYEAYHVEVTECQDCDGSGEIDHECDCDLCDETSEECEACDGEGERSVGHVPDIRPGILFGCPVNRNYVARVLAHAPAGDVRICRLKHIVCLAGEGWRSGVVDLEPQAGADLPAFPPTE